MRKIDLEQLQSEIERKKVRRTKKPKMKVSGASVRNLREIIIKKGKG